MTKTPTVVALRGLPLSGKTTLGGELSRRLKWPFVDVNKMREIATVQIRQDEVNPWNSEELAKKEKEDMLIAYTLMHEVVRVNINLGRSVIISATYSRQTSQQILLDIVRARPSAKLKGIRCVFNDTEEEIRRRIAARGPKEGFCATVEHYLTDKNTRHDFADLWGVLEINTSRQLEVCLDEALKFIGD